MKASRSLIEKGLASGNPASLAHALFRSGLNIGELRALTPLPENAQKLIDNAVVKVGLERLTVAADLMAENLVQPITDPLSILEFQWDQISKAGGAQRTMSPGARGENQLQDRTPKRVPIYCTTDDFSLNIRTLRASMRAGSPIDTSMVEECTRRVNEGIEDAVINGAGLQAAGYTTPGLLNAPSLLNQTRTADWSTTTGANILADTLAAITKAQNKKKYGPYNLYVGTAIGNHLNDDFKANGDYTIKQRLELIEAGGRNLKVRIADYIPSGTAVLVTMTSDVIDIITGLPPTVIPWTSADGFTLYWIVMAIMVPRVKDDYDGNSGICTITV